MSWLTETELADLRSDITALLPDTCTIQQPTATNSGGLWSETWSDVATVACRFDPFNPKDSGEDVSDQLDREAVLSVYRLTVPYNADLQEGYRVAHGGTQYFQVVQVSDIHSDRAVRRAVVVRIQGESSA